MSILFFIQLYIKINKDWVMVLDSSGQDAQDFKNLKNLKKFFKRTEICKIFNFFKILGFLARGTFLNF